MGDHIETMAIKEAFGQYAHDIPITAVKSMIGEVYSASGSFQMITALLSINKGIISPTINYKERDPICDLSYVFNRSRRSEVSKIMVNAFSPHGNHVSIIIGGYHP